MNRYFFLLLVLFGIAATANAQEMMLNGSFEECDGVAPPGVDPYNIEYGSYWHNLIGSCDLINPCVPDEPSGSPCFGAGCGRFGLNGTGYIEYLYGTTLPLTAGQIYEVSFWIKKDYPTESVKKVGLAITETVPTPSITSTTPLISELISSTQCVKLKACFTAQSSVTHYVTIGPFGGNANESILYLVDSVSVKVIPPSVPLPVSHVTASKPLYCMGEQVVLDGSASANETSYEWKIFFQGTQVYSSGILQGTAGTLNPMLPFAVPGSCYRAELTVYGVCKDVSTVDFCIANPNIDFVFDGNPVCENLPVDLQVTGDNGWTYTWTHANDTLSSGMGLQSLTVTPILGNSTYSVTITTPEGCTHTETLNLNVSSLSTQVPPTMNGINGTNTYTAYVQSGDIIAFNSLISNNSGELIETSLLSDNLPTNFSLTLPPNTSNGGNVLFSWLAPINTSGTYYFTVYLKDNNGCQELDNTYTFRIVVICDYCPICINYEERLPGNNPLPPVTKAGQCIEAGITDTVSTGDNVNITFQAGSYILEGPHFYAGPGYEAIIDSTTCVLGCEDCCSDFNGFTVDTPIPNIFSPNGDGINDIWFVRDDDHPWCAFGATGFELYIVNPLQIPVYEQIVYEGQGCCPFTALFPAPSSIHWDGRINTGTGKGQFVPDDVYFYVLYLHGCGQTMTYSGNISIYTTAGMIQSNESETTTQADGRTNNLIPNTLNLAHDGLPKDHFYVFPNPTENFVRIHAGKKISKIILLDANGKHILSKTVELDQPIDLSRLCSGDYRIRVFFEDQSIQEHIIVKN